MMMDLLLLLCKISGKPKQYAESQFTHFLFAIYSLRLAWHASGTYDGNIKNGGSDGATMRYKAEAEDPANAGLEHARTFLEPIKAKHSWISYADLWT